MVAGAPARLTEDVQGNILRAYGNEYRAVRHLVLRVTDPVRARRALGLMVDGDRATPDVTSAERAPNEAGYPWCLNVGFTFLGLRAMGVSQSSLDTFPPEFRDGMVARASRLGDVGPSAPAHWVGGLSDPVPVHVIVTIHGRQRRDVEQVSDRVLAAAGGHAFTPVCAEPLDGEALFDAKGRRLVHFGYADGISQPRLLGVHDPACYPDRLPFVPLGVALLGYPSAMPHVSWRVPEPDVLGRNGTFNAFRVLGQDVPAFEAFLASVEADHGGGQPGIDRELVAAKLCGRWRNGVPLSLAPTRAEADQFDDDPRLNDFDYVDRDPDGEVCPVGSHIRRTNPRGSHIVQRSANRTRAVIRRGVPYGPVWDPTDPASADVPRGLLGNFLCASLAAQFEALSYDWVNLGFQDPRITGTNDPIVGANDPATSTFTWPRAGADPLVVRGLPRFVSTRGGAYTFLPSLPALRWMASLTG